VNASSSDPFFQDRILLTFGGSSGAHVTAFTERFDACPIPKNIFHYTKTHGIEGILESGKVWLTDIFQLNDTRELKHGVAIALKIMKSQLPDAPRAFEWFSKIFIKHLEQITPVVAHFYVASFSHHEDDLSQWIQYGDEGRGFNVGFDCRSLEKYFQTFDAPGHASFPVTYDDNALRKLQLDLINLARAYVMIPYGRRGVSKNTVAYVEELAGILATQIIHASIYFKNPKFLSENEYRFLVIYPAGDTAKALKQRVVNGRTIPYLEFDWRKIPGVIRSIKVGPRTPKTARKRVRSLAVQRLSKKIKISLSAVPLRKD
jgi:hypothetical protein